MDKFKSISKLSSILETSHQAIEKWISEGKIEEQYIKRVPSRGRNGYKILIDPEGFDKKYHIRYQAWLAKNAEVDLSNNELEMQRLESLKPWERRHAMPYYMVIKKAEQFGLKGEDSLKAAVAQHNQDYPDHKDITWKSLYRNQRQYNMQGLDALIPGNGGNKGNCKIREEDWNRFDELYMTQNRRTVPECWRKTLGHAKKNETVLLHEGKYWMIDTESGDLTDTFPVKRTFSREIKRRYKKDVIDLARLGEHKFRQLQDDYVLNRDLSNIAPGEVWISDHRQLDVQCSSNKRDIKKFVKSLLYNTSYSANDKKQLKRRINQALAANFSKKKGGVRLWCTAWIDFKTGKWLSWYLHEDAPNTDHVMMTFKWAVQEYGVPYDVIIDNGKDYRARDFAGGREYTVKPDIDKGYVGGLLRALNVLAHFAIPYNARAKIIERQFQFWIESFEKDFPTYTGKNPSERPETTVINAKKGKFPTALEVIELFNEFIPLINKKARNGRELGGLSPDILWEKEYKPKKVREASLDWLAMRSSNIKQLKGNGFYDPDLDEYYYNESWMAGYVGERVYIKRDPQQWDVAWVFTEAGDELGKATIDKRPSGLARTDEQKAAVQGKLAHQNERRAFRKEQLSHLKGISAQEAQEDFKAFIELENEMVRHEHDLEAYKDNKGKVIEMQNTVFDDMAEKFADLEQKRTGTDDLDDIIPTNFANKSKMKELFETDEEYRKRTGKKDD